MGYDDGLCDGAPDGRHVWELDELVTAGPGLAQVHRCVHCSATVYEASAGDDPRRPRR